MGWHREVLIAMTGPSLTRIAVRVPCKSWVLQHGKEKIEPQPNATEERKSMMMIPQNLTAVISQLFLYIYDAVYNARA